MRFIVAWFFSVQIYDWFYENSCTSYKKALSKWNKFNHQLGLHGHKIHVAALSHFIDTFAAGFAFGFAFYTFALYQFCTFTFYTHPPAAPLPPPVCRSTCYKPVNNLKTSALCMDRTCKVWELALVDRCPTCLWQKHQFQQFY